MNRTLLVAAVTAALGVAFWATRTPRAPRAAAPAPAPAVAVPQPAPAPPSLPSMPEIDRDQARLAYDAAVARGLAEPGLAAFRDHTARFLEHNAEAAEDHARGEGLTLAEVAELTNLALIAQRMQDWRKVEALVGAPVRAPTRKLVAGLIHGDSEEMKLRLRDHVAAGDPEHVRAETIRAIWDHTLGEYFELTGMDRAKLDRLLADAVLGDVLALAPDADEDPPGDEPALVEGEVAEVADEAAPEANLIVIERVVPPTGKDLDALETEAANNPRFAAELALDQRRP